MSPLAQYIVNKYQTGAKSRKGSTARKAVKRELMAVYITLRAIGYHRDITRNLMTLIVNL